MKTNSLYIENESSKFLWTVKFSLISYNKLIETLYICCFPKLYLHCLKSNHEGYYWNYEHFHFGPKNWLYYSFKLLFCNCHPIFWWTKFFFIIIHPFSIFQRYCATIIWMSYYNSHSYSFTFFHKKNSWV